jgi:DNA repair protein RecN (Recombination protein N)
MLSRIKVKDYAIIEELEIEFSDGFNVFTGESGVGKSIIVDALGFCLGDRSDNSVIRSGAQRAIVEAVFTINDENILNKIKMLGFDIEGNEIIIRREYDASGKNKVVVNGFSESVSKVSELSELLVDFHGQHEHQSLLNQKTHIDYLDAFGKFQDDREVISNLYHNVIELKNKINELKEILLQKERRIEFLKFTVDELERAGLKEGEDIELEEKFKFITNFEALFRLVNESLILLDEGDFSVLSSIGKVTTNLRNATRYNEEFNNLIPRLEDAEATIKDVRDVLGEFKNKINLSPEDIEYINSRLDLVRTLKRKYNKGSVSELIYYKEECKKELLMVESGDEELKKLESEYQKLVNELKSKCLDLSKRRMSKAREFDKLVVDKLRELAMERAIFRTDFKYYKTDDGLFEIEGVKVDVNQTGIDRVEFLILVNPGEELKPLKKVASGGEISRVMLALKNVLSDVSEVDMMVFDEIDVGIGGNTANVVGEMIQEISKKRQIIVITHLPQVSSKANTHFKVDKVFEGSKTKVIVKELTMEERKKEIARMIGNETEVGIKYAEEMLTRSLKNL